MQRALGIAGFAVGGIIYAVVGCAPADIGASSVSAPRTAVSTAPLPAQAAAPGSDSMDAGSEADRKNALLEVERLKALRLINEMLDAAAQREAHEVELAAESAALVTAAREKDCAGDRAERQWHHAFHVANQQREVDMKAERQAYAERHCRHPKETLYRNEPYVDAKGYLRLHAVAVGEALVWHCPPGAPRGIEGNTEVSSVGAWKQEMFNYDVESRRNKECHDVETADGKPIFTAPERWKKPDASEVPEAPPIGAASSRPAPAAQSSREETGPGGVLDGQTSVFLTRADFDAATGFALTNNLAEFTRLAMKRSMICHDGIRVKILESDGGARRVRILSGPFSRASGWVSADDLRSE